MDLSISYRAEPSLKLGLFAEIRMIGPRKIDCVLEARANQFSD